ncbi:tRNA (adenosine(37)-N6)-threonylcarbamoyltransferase complex dimerization subunit type 1 TsaB [Aureisphaera sp. CAU 1614]|uniref:tRNA (Adenosine(37)-N6)-threonylcarbamoyltransferase complex dimerization subunit type 1 TsaB n=1 Tax=Halomarinibacterium sedimenti TaxID=2857106 RepID=A0A9X1FRS4_9FLAO|nr:tRNA (adenosine(37)-N6)-threonylcarbamoyltransferase complex dimerization subunit type 1 TsaB [Halomarinibacterium sedimenti]MBW2938652.1 tRNA (adenosine(37)-N6)-threonylcarbamoyltransferase complex dimerization subunit type 1 TsaB [Halomarinibacterium sedimenti]
MATILCLETATTNCSVALSENGSVIAFREDNSKEYSHAERLHVFIEEALEEANINLNDISAIAISKGPGSYTGLRIGVSSAKGLSYSLDKPLISIPTLQSLVMQVKDQTDYIIPMLDARRMEVYASVYNGKKQEIRNTKAEVLNENSFSEYLEKGTVTFIGNGVVKFKEICNHANAKFVEGKMPTALSMAFLAYEKFQQNDFEDVAYFEPYYLKDFIKT